MTDILLGIGVATFVLYAVYHIAYFASVKRASDRMAEFFQNTEANLNGVLIEMKGALENVKKITADVSEATEKVRRIAQAAAIAERSIRGVYGALKGSVGTTAGARIAGVKAGIRTGVVNLVKNLQEGRGDGHEGGSRKKGR